MDNDEIEQNITDYILPLLEAENDESMGKHDPLFLNTAKIVRTIINEIPGGFLIYRADNEKIVYANSAMFKIFKCNGVAEFRTLTGGTFRGIVHPDDYVRVDNEINEQILSSKEKLDYVEYRIIRKDGVTRWVEDYGHYVKSRNAVPYFYVFIVDATEKIARRMQEKATLINDNEQNERKIKNLIEEYDKERKLIHQEHLQRLEVIEGLSVNYDSIIYADIDKNVALPYRLSSRLVKQFTKKLETRELDWYLDDYVKVWVHPEDREYVAKHTSIDFIRSELRYKQTYYINYRCNQNGTIQYIQLRIVNVGEGGKVSQIVMGYRNIDDEMLQEMRQKKVMQAALANAEIADRAKNAFLSNMSHDMRTPLNAIFGYVQLAKKESVPASVLQYLDKIETAGNHILELVNKVLELSYAQAQNVTITESPCNVDEILKKVFDKIKPRADRNGIELVLNNHGITHPDVIADSEKLEQILGHIADNAVKYTKTGGTVTITATEQHSKTKELSTFIFKVQDNGIGISKQALSRIFDPFERESNTTQSGVFGSGLGLTITKQMVEAMNGTITAKSTLGKGSTFTVTISLRSDMSKQTSTTASADEQPDLSGKKILIVEDNEVNLEIETEILQDLGFVIDSAENGEIAVQKIKRAKKSDYDLVLMDIQMPVMDGRTAAREIRGLKRHPLSDIPIIALSANAFESDRRASLEVGMDAHLTKPLDVDALLRTFRNALNARKD